jgi:ABC-type branched-subunit amino acid transport system ATPase component
MCGKPSSALKPSDVAFALHTGEIHALVGASDTGKSTFSRIVSGHSSADRGEIRLFGAPARFASAREAIRADVTMMMQETNLAPDLSAIENIPLNSMLRAGSPGVASRGAGPEVLDHRSERAPAVAHGVAAGGAAGLSRRGTDLARRLPSSPGQSKLPRFGPYRIQC